MPKQDVEIKKIQGPLNSLNNAYKSLISNIVGSGSDRDKERENLTKDIDNAIYKDMQNLTDHTGDNISVFLAKTLKNLESGEYKDLDSIDDLFSNESSGLFSFFQERYRNNNIMLEDLHTLSEQLYELQEAVSTTRDSIVASDDNSNIISRVLKFTNSAENTEDNTVFTSSVERLESQFKLLQKIKEHVIPKTLTYGSYYVYTVPYSVLFKQHYDKQQKMAEQNVMESSTYFSNVESKIELVTEQYIMDFKNELNLTSKDTFDKSKALTSFNGILENLQVINDENISIPVLEGDDGFSALLDIKMEKAKKEANRRAKKSGATLSGSVDGTVDVKGKKNESFDDISDCYVQLIDPKKIIPVKIMDEVIGYYYIHEQEIQAKKSMFTTSIRLSKSSSSTSTQIENTVLNKVTDTIVKSFDKKYLNENAKFRRLILSAISYNDIYKKKLKFQFIPVDYITEFTVNEDENGVGRSILYPSLFYAKLYLALLMFKIITIISRSNDTRINYVHTSGMDKGMANKVQSVARSLKQREINFNDLMQSNSLISKVGALKDIYMPVGKSGEKGIEFDILAGQDVQLNTELMEMLRAGAISATGVPSVIINYINEADYAKTLVMANAKFMARVVSLQMDFNPSITELYKKIIRYSSNSIPEDVIDTFEFTLNPPRAINAMNMMDIINNAEQVVAYMLKSITGENANQSDIDNVVKDAMFLELSKEMLPMLPWSLAEKMFEEASVKAKVETTNKKSESDEETAE